MVTPAFVLAVIGAALIGILLGYLYARGRTYLEIRDARRDALSRGRATIRGQVAEQLAPLSEGFPYAAADARFLGAPIDYVVFDGLTSNDDVEVVLVEMKTGRARLSSNEKRVRDAVTAGRVRFEVVRL